MKITLYTISDCQFSKQEKEYLTAHNLPFEEKNLEINREYLTEMLTISNNFAGTPVSKIEKDDGQIIIIKGFTQEEFDQALGFTTPTVTQDQSVATQEVTPPPIQAPVVAQPLPEQPVMATPSASPLVPEETPIAMPPTPVQSPTITPEPVMPVPSQPMVPQPPVEPVTPMPVEPQTPVVPSVPSVEPPMTPPATPVTAPQAPTNDSALNAILTNLQAKVSEEPAATNPSAAPSPMSS